jgi:hypothetical protein
LDTVTVTDAELVFPAASNALAVIVCGPFATVVVSHTNPYGPVVDVASFTPSTQNSTDATPALSDAAAATVTDPVTVDPSNGAVTDTTGGTASGHAAVAALVDACPEWFPAPSNASTATAYDVPHSNPLTVNDVAVVVPTETPFTNTVYPTTPTLSDDADHPTDTDATVAPVRTNPDGVLGGAVSTQGLVAPTMVARGERRPAASNESTASE